MGGRGGRTPAPRAPGAQAVEPAPPPDTVTHLTHEGHSARKGLCPDPPAVPSRRRAQSLVEPPGDPSVLVRVPGMAPFHPPVLPAPSRPACPRSWRSGGLAPLVQVGQSLLLGEGATPDTSGFACGPGRKLRREAGVPARHRRSRRGLSGRVRPRPAPARATVGRQGFCGRGNQIQKQHGWQAPGEVPCRLLCGPFTRVAKMPGAKLSADRRRENRGSPCGSVARAKGPRLEDRGSCPPPHTS